MILILPLINNNLRINNPKNKQPDIKKRAKSRYCFSLLPISLFDFEYQSMKAEVGILKT